MNPLNVTNMRAASYWVLPEKRERFGVTGARYFQRFSSSWHCYIVSFMNVSTFLESWFIIYPFLTSRNADMTIFYSRKVLKTFNHHLNYKRKLTIITAKTLCDHFDRVYGSLILSSPLYTLDVTDHSFLLLPTVFIQIYVVTNTACNLFKFSSSRQYLV